jgi:hypothetical protein
VPCDLHTEVARKPIGALDQNDPHAVAGNPVEHGLEARSLGHRMAAPAVKREAEEDWGRGGWR